MSCTDIIEECFFSIVIPTYNRGPLLLRAILSCLSQSFASFELVVVDDGSTDGTEENMAGLKDPRVRYIRQENSGAARARNRGAQASAGRYIAFLDSDDEFLPRKLELFHAAITAAEQEDAQLGNLVWYSPLYFHRGVGNQAVKPSRAIQPGERVGDYLFVNGGMMQTSTLVIPRDLFLQVGFNQGLRSLQDLDLCLRLEGAGASFRMLETPLSVWYDDFREGRVSYATTAEQVVNWANAQRELLSERAYYGFLVRHLLPLSARKHPIANARLLGTAFLHGSVSAWRGGSLMLRGTMPGTYSWFRDLLVSRRRA